LRFGFGSSRIAVEYVSNKFFTEGFSHLRPAGIVDTDESDFGFIHEKAPYDLLIIIT
jgi:hypothetical protein